METLWQDPSGALDPEKRTWYTWRGDQVELFHVNTARTHHLGADMEWHRHEPCETIEPYAAIPGDAAWRFGISDLLPDVHVRDFNRDACARCGLYGRDIVTTKTPCK